VACHEPFFNVALKVHKPVFLLNVGLWEEAQAVHPASLAAEGEGNLCSADVQHSGLTNKTVTLRQIERALTVQLSALFLAKFSVACSLLTVRLATKAAT